MPVVESHGFGDDLKQFLFCDADGLTRDQFQQSCVVDGWFVGVGRLGFAVKKNISCVGASRGMCVAQGQQRQSTHRQKLASNAEKPNEGSCSPLTLRYSALQPSY
jgi:hypothetical protein